MTNDKLVRAWVWLLILSIASTAAAFLVSQNYNTTLAGCFILGLSLIKSRIILGQYLGLNRAPYWQGGFNFVLALFLLAATGLFLVPAF